VREFLDSVRMGRERVVPVEGDATALTLDPVSPWDGSDGEQATEDEFSLEDLGLAGDGNGNGNGDGDAKDEL